MKIMLKSVEKIKGGRKPNKSQLEAGELLYTKTLGHTDAFTEIIQNELVGRVIEVTEYINEDGKMVPDWFTTIPGFAHSIELNVHRSWFNEVD